MDCIQKYDKKVRIERLNATADAHGHIDESDDDNWETFAIAYCECVSKGGREFWKVQQVSADVSHVWKCPWSKTVAKATTDMRIIFESKAYNILAVIDENLAHETIQIQTKRAV